MTDTTKLDINGIMLRLPHRYPFLLVDRVLECVRGQSIRALKNVTYNEPYFTGHFPHRPMMPGVIIIEALAQVAGLLAFLTADELPDDRTPLLFRRHRQGAVPQAGRARRPADPESPLRAQRQGHLALRHPAAEVEARKWQTRSIMIAPDLKREASCADGGAEP